MRSLNFLEIKLRQPRIVIALAVSFLLFYLAPLLVYGQNLYFQIYDNLDSNVVWLKILAESGMIFADSNAIIPNMMGGLPRHTYGSEFNVQLWLFYFFKPITAYIINELIIHIIAFVAMWIFLSHHVIKPTRGNTIVIVTGALYFALLPFWPWGGLSVPAMPLVVHAMLNIRSRTATWRDWAVLGLIPLYSSFVLVYFFFLITAGFFWIVDSIRKRDWQWQLIGAIVFMGIVYLGVEYRLVYSTFFDPTFVSHRVEFTSLFHSNSITAYRDAVTFFLNGQDHTKGNHYLLVLPFTVLALLLVLIKRRLNCRETIVILVLFALAFVVDIWSTLFTTRYFIPIAFVVLLLFMVKLENKTKKLPLLLLVSIVISLWYGFWFHEFWKTVKPYLPFIETFNMSRFIFIQPMIWASIVALNFWLISQKIRYISVIIFVFCSLEGYIAVKNSTFLVRDKKDPISYQTYYSEGLFKAIEDYIGLPQSSYRIGSLGLDPTIALYNRFYTIDGYSVNYSLQYKHQFKKIIDKELVKNKGNQILFDGWGSKCFLFTQKVSYLKANKSDNYAHLELDINQMYDLGGRFLLTTAKIPDPQKGLEFLEKFEDKNAYWKLYLYKVNHL